MRGREFRLASVFENPADWRFKSKSFFDGIETRSITCDPGVKSAIKKSTLRACEYGFVITEKLLALALEKRAVRTPIDRPIIIIGPERSGTSFIYALLATHPDVYALTTAADRFPDHPFSATLARNLLSPASTQIYRVVPKTIGEIQGGRFDLTEAIRYWERHLGTWNGGWKKAPDDVLTAEDLDDATRRTLPLDLKKRLFMIRKQRLVLKQPGFSLKISYLNAVFPDAIFVHCLRNPFDNFLSLLEQKRRFGDPDWGVKIPQTMRLRNASIEAQTARQLAGTYELILQNFNRIEDRKRCVTVRYESFGTDFVGEARRLFQPCGLETPPEVLAHPELFVASRSRRKPQAVTDDQQAWRILEKLAGQMGYDFSETSSGTLAANAV